MQISCGKRHMLAVVSSRGRVYSWGLGGAGQLGTRVTHCVTTPQVVLGPWVSLNGSVLSEEENPTSEDTESYVIKRVTTGSDHCFATVTQKKASNEIVPFHLTGERWMQIPKAQFRAHCISDRQNKLPMQNHFKNRQQLFSDQP